MTWKPEVDELAARRARALDHGGPEATGRHRQAGKLLARNRISVLVGSEFREYGQLAGSTGAEGTFLPSNAIVGLGRCGYHDVSVSADDRTVRGGSVEGGGLEKLGFADRLALELRIPRVRLLDGVGGSLRAANPALGPLGGRMPQQGGAHNLVEMLQTVPVVSAALGSIAGQAALLAVMAHWSAMVRETSHVFPSGPPLVKRALGLDISKEDLGGWRVHTRNGVIDNAYDSEEECISAIGRFLSYLPSSVWELPSRQRIDDPPDRRDEWLLEAMPRDRRSPHDVKRIINSVADRGSFFETGPNWGRAVVTGLARFDGFPAGVVASNPRFDGGAMDAAAAEKYARLVDLCDLFHLPVIVLWDQPGFMLGPHAEAAGTIRRGARLMSAVVEARVPWMTVVLRRAYGVGGGLMSDAQKLNLRLSWPAGEWGTIPVEGGVDAVFRREIAAAADPDGRRRELEEQLARDREGFCLRAAEVFQVEDVIDPRDTRPAVCQFLALAQRSLTAQVGRRAGTVRP